MKYIDVVCPFGCYRHKRLVGVLMQDNEIYEGVCFDCKKRITITAVLLIEDVTDRFEEFSEVKRVKQLILDLQCLGYTDIADNIKKTFKKARMLK